VGTPVCAVTRLDDQRVGEIPVNPPVAFLVSVSQIASCDVAADTEVIELGFLRAQTNFDVAQALAEGQLRKGHAQKLVQMRKGFSGIVRRVSCNAPTKGMQRQKIHKLRKNQFTNEHGGTPRPKTPVSQISVQVGNTHKNRLLIATQHLAPCQLQNCRTAVIWTME